MNFLSKRFSDLKIRTKLFFLIGIFLISLIILGSVVNILFRSSQTMTILANEERKFVEYFNAGIKYFYQYELSGEKDDLDQAGFYFQKAIDYAGTFAKIDSIVGNMPRDEWLPYLYGVYKEGVDYDRDKIELMGKQVGLFTAINPGKLQEIQNLAMEASLLGKEIVARVNEYAENKSEGQFEHIQLLFDDADALTQEIATGLLSLNDYFNRIFFLIKSF